MEARVRLGCGRALLKHLRASEPETEAAVLASLSDETREAYDSLNALRWLPFALHMELSERIREAVGGGDANVQVSRHAFRALLGRPMLRGFVRSIMRLSDDPTRAVFERVPRLHAYLFEGIGEVRTHIDPDDERVGHWTIRGFPDERYSFYCFLESACGAIEGTETVVPDGLRATIRSVGGGEATIRVERFPRV